jgi:RNA-directed DNA polymerase
VDQTINQTLAEFRKLQSRQDIAAYLGVQDEILCYILYSPRCVKYREFEVPKKSGGVRIIHSPQFLLRNIQKELNKSLQELYVARNPAFAFIKGRSIIDNAEKHLRQRYVLNLDLKDFFPSINFGRVVGLLKNKPYCLNPKVAIVLGQICCHYIELDGKRTGRIPQGAPTSPVISNMICAQLDSQLQKLAKKYGCLYTRYADDITFSTSKNKFPGALAFFSDEINEWLIGQELRDIIQNNGFLINQKKVRLATREEHQQVTGITVNRKLNLRRTYIKQVRAMLYSWETKGLKEAEDLFHEKFDIKHREAGVKPSFKRVVKGRIDFIGSVKGKSDPVYRRLLLNLARLDPTLVSQEKLRNILEIHAQILTEGKTDISHIKAALNFFQSRGEFSNIHLTFSHDTDKNGDDKLKKHCESLAMVSQNIPVIAIFDRDSPSILKDVHDDRRGFKDWGNGVYSFALPVPAHRENPEVCIELYYQDHEIKRSDSSGRRLFLNSEFHPESCIHIENADLITTDHPSVKSYKQGKVRILEHNVFNRESQNVALPKSKFANSILNQESNFNDFDFSAFAAIFELILRITTQPS